MPRSQQAKNKAAGTQAETKVVEYLKQWWPGAERRRLTGAHDRGDIAGVGDPVSGRTVIEVKNEKKFNLSGYLKELAAEVKNDGAKHGVVILRKRGTTDVGQWYAIMPVADWVKLRRAAERTLDVEG